MHTVRRGPVIGLGAQILVLAVVDGAVGLGGAGWAAGVTYGVGTCAALVRGMGTSGRRAFGPADWVTLGRATLAGAVAALVAVSFVHDVRAGVLVALAAVALVLDGVDGQVARRTGTSSDLGARFDMEVDALLIGVLSVDVARSVGPWVLAIGAMRYTFVAAGWALPWLRGTLPPRYWRKVVAATQGIVLVVAASGVLPALVTVAAVGAALALLVESFGRDMWWLWVRRDGPSTPGTGRPT